MSDDLTEELVEKKVLNGTRERLNFVLLVIAFVALAMFSQHEQQPVSTSKKSTQALNKTTSYKAIKK